MSQSMDLSGKMVGVFLCLCLAPVLGDKLLIFSKPSEAPMGTGTSQTVPSVSDELQCAVRCALAALCRAFRFADDGSCRICKTGSDCSFNEAGAVVMMAEDPLATPVGTPSAPPDVSSIETSETASGDASTATSMTATTTPMETPVTTSALAVLGGRVTTPDGRTFELIQQRVSGAVNFSRTWNEYEAGFGTLENFWIGLQRIHTLTQPNGTTLRVQFRSFDSFLHVYEYSGFIVAGADTNYTVTYADSVLPDSKIAFDAMAGVRNQPFFTMDHDKYASALFYYCSESYGNSGWWFGQLCTYVNPNGEYSKGFYDYSLNTAFWIGTEMQQITLQEIQMMVQI